MHRVFVSSPIGNSREMTLSGETARYLGSVLRLGRGDLIVLFDPKGEHFEAEITSISRGKVEVSITTTLGRMAEPEGGVILAMGILKGTKMELVIQKAVELGVSGIVPLEARRTVVRETRKLDRWQKIALEAARQSGRPSAPAIEPPIALDAFFERDSGPLAGVVFYEAPGLGALSPDDLVADSGQHCIVAVGPEGGFTPEEVELMADKGLKPRTLGGNILRAETAAIAAVTLAQYLTGRLGRPDINGDA